MQLTTAVPPSASGTGQENGASHGAFAQPSPVDSITASTARIFGARFIASEPVCMPWARIIKALVRDLPHSARWMKGSRRGCSVVVALSLSLAVTGCHQEEAPPNAPIPPGPLPTPPERVLASNAQLSCELLVPAAVRETFLKDWSEEPVPEAAGIPNAPRRCHFVKGTPPSRVKLAFDCRRRATDAELERMKQVLLTDQALEVPGLGRAAVKHTSRPGLVQLTTWDADSPCYLLVTWLGEGNEQVSEVARALLDGLDAQKVLP